MAKSDHAKLVAHTVRDKSGLLDPVRDPHAITDVHKTGSVPKSGKHSGDGIDNPDGHAGADTRGL